MASSSRSFFLLAAVIGLGLWSLVTLRFQTELLPLFPENLPSVQMLKKAQAHFVSEREILAVPTPGTNSGWATLAKLAEAVQSEPGVGAAQVGMGAGGSPDQWLAGMAVALPPAEFQKLPTALAPGAVETRLQKTLGDMSGAVDETEMGRFHFDPLQLVGLIVDSNSGADPLAAMTSLPPVLSIDSSAPLKTFADDQLFTAQVRHALEAASRKIGLSPAPSFLLTGQPAITAEISTHMRRDIIVMVIFTITLTSLAFWLTYRSLMPLLWIIVAQLLAVLCAIIAARFIFQEINVLSIGFSSILLGVGMDYCILVYHFHAQPGELDGHEWQELRRAIWLSSVTTAATFGVLYFSSFPGLRQLAVLVGFGLVATAYFATTFLAGLLRQRRPRAPRWLGPASKRCALFMSRHRLAFRLVAIMVILGAILLLPELRKFHFYDPSVEQLEPTNLESYQAQKILQDATTHLPQPSYRTRSVDANRQAWTFIDPARLRRQFDAAGFDSTWSATTLAMVGDLNQWQAGRLDLTGPAQADTAWVQLRTDLNDAALGDFKRLSIFMFLIVLALCAVAHRSPRLVGLNLAALGMSLLLLALGLYASQTSMTILSLLCIPLMIGLVIDYSLHILLALEHARGDLVEAFRHLAVPVLLTGTAAIIGFTAPMLSSQPALQNFGNVMDLGTAAAVASGLLLLPAIYGRLKHVHIKAPISTAQHGPASFDMETGGGEIVSPIPTSHHAAGFYTAPMFGLADTIARLLPLRVTRALANNAGRLYAWTHPASVEIVRRNLQLLDDKLDVATARRVYGEFGKTLADYFYIGTRPIPKAARIISQTKGEEHLRAAHALGRGAIIVTAHLGLFELGGLLMAQSGFPSAALTFPEPSNALTTWRAAFRKRWGVETIEIGSDNFAFLAIAQRLRRGCFVATLIDRPHPQENIPVRLSHGDANFSTGILLLAAHCVAPVIPATMVRQNDGTYHAQVFPPIFIQPRATRAETLSFYSQQIADILLPVICAHPEQWYQFVPVSSSA